MNPEPFTSKESTVPFELCPSPLFIYLFKFLTLSLSSLVWNSNPPSSALLVAEITGMYPHAQAPKLIFFLWKFKVVLALCYEMVTAFWEFFFFKWNYLDMGYPMALFFFLALNRVVVIQSLIYRYRLFLHQDCKSHLSFLVCDFCLHEVFFFPP